MKKQPQHGGRRVPGPGKALGRPKKSESEKRVTLCLTLDPAVDAYLRSTGEPSNVVDAMVRRSKAFREWAKANPGSADDEA